MDKIYIVKTGSVYNDLESDIRGSGGETVVKAFRSEADAKLFIHRETNYPMADIREGKVCKFANRSTKDCLAYEFYIYNSLEIE